MNIGIQAQLQALNNNDLPSYVKLRSLEKLLKDLDSGEPLSVKNGIIELYPPEDTPAKTLKRSRVELSQRLGVSFPNLTTPIALDGYVEEEIDDTLLMDLDAANKEM